MALSLFTGVTTGTPTVDAARERKGTGCDQVDQDPWIARVRGMKKRAKVHGYRGSKNRRCRSALASIILTSLTGDSLTLCRPVRVVTSRHGHRLY